VILFELMANIALMVGDVCAVLSAAGSAILLLLGIVTGNKAEQVSVFFGFSKSTIGLLLLLSLGLLAVRVVVRPR
jgi:hypothetical protein